MIRGDGRYDLPGADIAWCPGCGNFGILSLVKSVLQELGKDPKEVVLVSGIGQAAKAPHYLKANVFNGLHGRAIPAAVGIKASNPDLTVIVESGDGDMYGEGGNHFLHAMRKNPDITCFVHDNMVYGLTKGQASPTSRKGFITPVQVHGVAETPFNPLAVAIATGATFVGRVFVGHAEEAKEVMKEAILHRGFSLVDIFQPCVTYNKLNTYSWFRDHTRPLPEGHDPSDRLKALSLSFSDDPLYTGIFYRREGEPTFEDVCGAYIREKSPLFTRKADLEDIRDFVEGKRV